MRQTRNNIFVRLALLFVLMTVSLSASAGDVQLRKGGSIVGRAEGMTDKRQVAVMYFFGFFNM